MNENWPEIVETLLPYFGVNSAEGDCQREIEICLKFLGWKKTNETMRSQLTLPIGNNSSIRPDIVLWKKNANGVPTPVLPIEIKRPSNIRNERQENQLMSYMRQLKLNVGLYIGEKIELYYDVPNDGESPVCVFTVEIQKEDANGSTICDLLTYDTFSLKDVEAFCYEQYQRIQARNNLHRQFTEFLSPDNGVKNMLSLLKEKFMKAGSEESAINEEIANVVLTVHYEKNNAVASLSVRNPQIPQPLPIGNQTKDSKDHTKYSFDGINFHVKRRFVLEVIKHYIEAHPNIRYKELEKVFPPSLHSRALGVVRSLEEVREKLRLHPDLKKRYFLKEEEIIPLADGTRIVVNNQWGTLFPKFLAAVQKLYTITDDAVHHTENAQQVKVLEVNKKNSRENNTPVYQLKITFENGKVIQEKKAAETLRQFIMTVGIKKVSALGIKQCNVPLVSNILDSKYGSDQKPIGNGWYLMSRNNTHSKKRDIERIAKALGIQVTVEIV